MPDASGRFVGITGVGANFAWCPICEVSTRREDTGHCKRCGNDEVAVEPAIHLTGEQVYKAYREAMKHHARLRGLSPEPRWKDLKPWLKNVWNRTALALDNPDDL